MNSLALARLRVYDDSDSDTDEEEDEKFKKRLPVPKLGEPPSTKKSEFTEVDQDGKVRNFPHEPGNWATYVYLPVESIELSEYLSQLIEFFAPVHLKLVDDFHISLTRTIVLRHHWIQDFTTSIKNRLGNISSFKIHLYNLKAFCNEQKTRTFLSLKVEEGIEYLKELVNELDDCLKDYNLETFYKNPSFHLSLLWSPGDKQQELERFIKRLPSKLKSFDLPLNIFLCVCASGNKKFHFKLANHKVQ